MELNYAEIGSRIKVLRKAAGISQDRLAELTDMSAKYISHIETGRKTASLKSVIKIAAAFDIPVDILIPGKQESGEDGYEKKIRDIISDCSIYEKNVILDSVIAIKRSLRNSKGVIGREKST